MHATLHSLYQLTLMWRPHLVTSVFMKESNFFVLLLNISYIYLNASSLFGGIGYLKSLTLHIGEAIRKKQNNEPSI